MGDEVKTIKDLFEWAIEHNAFNLELSLQYQDYCGHYMGHTLRNGLVARVSLVTDKEDKFVLLS
nr:MAG TPA: hypothetical protein [Caudoviricetes sp.]